MIHLQIDIPTQEQPTPFKVRYLRAVKHLDRPLPVTPTTLIVGGFQFHVTHVGWDVGDDSVYLRAGGYKLRNTRPPLNLENVRAAFETNGWAIMTVEERDPSLL